jgi:hypothetical protein
VLPEGDQAIRLRPRAGSIPATSAEFMIPQVQKAVPHSLAVNLGIAAFALLLFQLVAFASGLLPEHGGLGWDGVAYARMVTGRLSEGSPNTAVRPLVIFAVRLPYWLGLDVLHSFQVMNAVAAFALYVVASLLLARGGLNTGTRTVVVANLALTISVSKMYGFYPALIDLGAIAVIAVAFYLAATDRYRSAAAACILATASREFGMAAPLFGIHRTIRTGRPRDALLFLPSVIVPFLIRLPALGIVPPDESPLSLRELATDLRLWEQPPFVVAFAYFSITLLGGITVLLVLRLARVLASLRAEPELATFAGFVVVAAAAGSADIWRYLVFVLPVALVLAAACLVDLNVAARRQVLVIMTIVTVLTQRPFQTMTVDSYFLDWFPVYGLARDQPVPPKILAVWLPRLALLALILVAFHLLIRRATRREGHPTNA